MSSVEITIDYVDVAAAAEFWMAAAGYERRYRRPPYEVLGPPPGEAGPVLVLQQVAAPPPASRAHLDLRVEDPPGTVERLRRLGATVTGEVAEAGTAWTVMADPWGNAFCVCPAR